MNPDHHNINTGGGQPPGNSETQSQRVPSSQQQQSNSLTPTTSATDLRVNSAAVNVALSSVAKYWVFTNLFPGPIPQVSVYGLPTSARLENGKPVQDIGQAHPSILNGDPNIILGHHGGQQPVAVSASGQQIPVSQIIASQSSQDPLALTPSELSSQQSSSSTAQVTAGASQSSHQVPNNRVEFVQHHNIDMSHHTSILQQQLMAASRQDHANQQIQLTLSEDGTVTVVEPGGSSKLVDKEELHGAIKMPTDHALTVHQLQQIVGHHQNPDGTTSIETSSTDLNLAQVKDEKTTIAIPADIKDIKGIDLKNVGAMGMEGTVVKISTGSDQDLHTMYKVNVEDLSQLLAYHEVFGKLNTETQQQPKVIAEVEVVPGTSGTIAESETSPGHHACDICGKIFQFRYQLIVHRHGKCHLAAGDPVERQAKRIAHDKPYACTTCHKTFSRKEHLDNHVRSHTGETPYRCQFCAKTFTRKEHMVNHVRKHTGETPHRCEICKKSFTRKEHFMNHVMWHTGETPHRCDFCSKTFTRKEHLLNHVRQHTGESPHRCNYCAKSFTRREHLVNHVRQHTGETPFQCGYCPKAFTRKDHLVNHVRQHTGESPHKCSFCTKSFTRKEHLTNHVRQHTGESPHRCSYCSKSFTRKEHLNNHVRIHTGESPHRCEFCNKTFTRKEHLTNHMKQHSGDTVHPCKICSKPFARKELLATHMRSHSCGERPFSCGECGKSFPLKGNLLFHERSHNKGGASKFRCDICNKDFMCKSNLMSHRRTHLEAGEAAAEDCGDCDKEEPVERKHNIREPSEGRSTENVVQDQQNASTVMQQITNQAQVRAPASGSSVGTGSFAHPAGTQHHSGAAIAHHTVTVNY